ncbi:MAG: beta-ketoacyl-ACP synthase II [Clostridiaceae bacterium]|jgi:3-oxoacyl-[acyl-carrier-protein] synthase II|nr:beta-ketoacyl-ACP synthase II [Clostridiaceae bacterium]
MSRRVVITGTGVVHALGKGTPDFWNAIKEGKNGITGITKFDCSRISTKVASEITDFDPSLYFEKKEAKRLDLFTQYAIAASCMAINESGIDVKKEDPFRLGVLIGSGIGGILTLEDQKQILMEKGPQRISPFFIPMMIANMASGYAAIKFGFQGFNECVVTACATANHAIGDAFNAIRWGMADVMLTGGSEAAYSELAFAGFCAAKAMTTESDPELACRPFDKNRSGFVMGEGAGILVLEELEHALNRGANIIAEVIGYGCTCDAYHVTAPHPEGVAGIKAMQFAINDAGIKPEQVDYINAHGTSTPLNDSVETMVIKKVFGDHAYKLAVSSTKSMTGHLLGAAGGIEAIITAMALKEGFLPPTIHLETPDEECDLDYIPNQGRKADIKYALSNALGFGGHNAVIALKKYE